jgi:hypothetical protein
MPGKNKDIKSWYVKISETYIRSTQMDTWPLKNNRRQKSTAEDDKTLLQNTSSAAKYRLL